MKSSKLIDILRSFSITEIKGLSIFIEKQMDKKNTLPQKLFLEIEKYYPDFKENDIKKERVFVKVFSKQPYNENKFSKLMSELTKISESYIIYMKSQEDVIKEKMHLLHYYFERNLDKYFVILAREIRTLIHNLPLGSRQNMLKYQFEELIVTYELKLENRIGNYEKVCNELYEFIETERLRWENLRLMELCPIKSIEQPKQPFYTMHNKLNKMLQTQDAVYFNEVMANIENDIKQFDKEESREILKILLFFVLQKCNNGFAEYYVPQFRLYNLFIELKLILNHYGVIHISTYKNYINVALRLEKIEEAELFLEHYKQYLPGDLKEDVYHFNKAFILFEKGKFDDVLRLLSNVKFDDVYYNISQRRIIIKTYYELLQYDNSYFELLNSNINAFKKFIYTKDQVSDLHVTINKNFLKILQKIEKNSDLSKKKIREIEQELQTVVPTAEKNWLIKKVNALL
ncbi:MAG: hypothetical protein U0U67_12925 [Chitinophagales bacterium]